MPNDLLPQNLRELFSRQGRIGLAFSGGSDSAYLFYALTACEADFRVYYVQSAFQPAFETEDAKQLARQLGKELTIITLDVLADETVRSNPKNRCYYCKRRIFGAILEQAKKDGCSCVIDGTNASDDVNDRPGMKALAELEVLSPLRVCGITKDMQREYARQAGLFTWNKPSYACLATRFPTGMPITAEKLQTVEASENALFALGFSDFRVRLNGDDAMLELPEAQFALLLEKRSTILRELEPYFSRITLNLRSR